MRYFLNNQTTERLFLIAVKLGLRSYTRRETIEAIESAALAYQLSPRDL